MNLTATTVDGRSGSAPSQVIHVLTKDIAISKFSVPQTARVNQTKTINVELLNKRYSDYVQVTLVKGLPGGGEQAIGTLTLYVPAKAKQSTIFKFSYTFTPDDAAIGKVTFKTIATIVNGRDAFLSDNTIYCYNNSQPISSLDFIFRADKSVRPEYSNLLQESDH